MWTIRLKVGYRYNRTKTFPSPSCALCALPLTSEGRRVCAVRQLTFDIGPALAELQCIARGFDQGEPKHFWKSSKKKKLNGSPPLPPGVFIHQCPRTTRPAFPRPSNR
jgi:hypothetical protein